MPWVTYELRSPLSELSKLVGAFKTLGHCGRRYEDTRAVFEWLFVGSIDGSLWKVNQFRVL